MVLLTVSGFILGGIITYLFVPSNLSDHPRPPWSPRSDVRQEESSGGKENQAGKEPSEEEKRAKFLNMWKERLELSDEQTEQLRQIFDAGHLKFEAAANSAREKYSQIRRETDEEILKILNPEQADRYKKITEEFRARRERERTEQEKGRNGPGPGRPGEDPGRN